MAIGSSRIIRRTKYRRFIPELDAPAIAKAVARRGTETGACLLLGINPQSWHDWKMREGASDKFATLLLHAREEILNHHLNNIDDAAFGRGPHERADWRASKAIIEISHPELNPNEQGQGPVTMNISFINDTMKRVYDAISPPARPELTTTLDAQDSPSQPRRTIPRPPKPLSHKDLTQVIDT